jgi:hypothetical protein
MLVRSMLKNEFHRIDPAIARVVLVDMAPRVLGTFAAELSEAVQHRLKKLGVEVRLGHGVDQIDADGVVVGGERIASKVVIWTAGVAPSPAGKWLNVETDRAGRVRVQDDLTVPGYPYIYVIGDTAFLQQDGMPLPGVAQVAIQQGQYAGRRIAQSLLGQPSSKPFRYFDKGNMAVVGAGFRSPSNRARPAERDSRLACSGRDPPRVSHNYQSAPRRSSAMALEFCDTSDRGSVDRESLCSFQTEYGPRTVHCYRARKMTGVSRQLPGVSNAIGLIEITTALLIASRPFSPKGLVLGQLRGNHYGPSDYQLFVFNTRRSPTGAWNFNIGGYRSILDQRSGPIGRLMLDKPQRTFVPPGKKSTGQSEFSTTCRCAERFRNRQLMSCRSVSVLLFRIPWPVSP